MVKRSYTTTIYRESVEVRFDDTTYYWPLLGETLNRTGIIRKLLDYYIYYVNEVT